MTRIVRTITIDAPFEEVHSAARDPHHWTEWISGLGDRGSIRGVGDAGSFGEFDLIVTGMHFPVRLEVRDDVHSPAGCRCITESKGAGPDFTSTFSYEPRDGKTVVTAEMEYELSGAVFGRIADRLVVERLEERSLEHSLGNLKVLAEAMHPALQG